MKKAHFLRPELTTYLIKQLQRGDAINIYGSPGIGKSRLLEDIRKADISDLHVTRPVSFRGFCKSYQGFCEEVWNSTGLDTTKKSPKTFNEIIEQLDNSKKKILLIIDDFQYLSENPNLDTKFNQRFIDSLNGIKNMAGVSLLVVSLKPLTTLTLYIKPDPVTSILSLKPLEIEQLSSNELEHEVHRRYKRNRTIKESIPLLVGYICDLENNYALLDYFVSKIVCLGDQKISHTKLQAWESDFRQARRSSGTKKAMVLNHHIKKWNLVLNPLPSPLSSIFKKLKKPIAILQVLVEKLNKSKDTSQ